MGVFDRILCGIDTTRESLEAAAQAALLAPAGSRLLLVTVTQPLAAAPPGFTAIAAQVLGARREAERALERAAARIEKLREADTALLEGAPVPTLLAALETEQATLVAVGIHRGSRVAAVALGSVATALLHDAPCSVYVGRRAGAEAPRSIRVGVDGSRASAEAFLVARELAGRLGAELEPVVALGGRRPDVPAARAAAAGAKVREDPREAVDALVAPADLVVVGSRGLHGLRALGSVSERVAHRAPCSVLVVRQPRSPRGEAQA